MHLDVNLSLLIQSLLVAVLLALGKWVWNQSLLVATLTAEFKAHKGENVRDLERIETDIRMLRGAA